MMTDFGYTLFKGLTFRVNSYMWVWIIYSYYNEYQKKVHFY